MPATNELSWKMQTHASFADFNGDGWPSIVAARSDAPNALWFSTEPMPRR
jgi:predicted Rossmann fold nucleotide-binding protein DprA/Smf involved in DNA uptake